jgi:hypothetical protein
MKKKVSEYGGNSMLVATIPHTFNNAIKKPARMKVGLKRTGIISWTYTVTVKPTDKTGSLPCSHDVTIDANNPRQSASVSFHVGRAIVSFSGNHIVMLFIKSRHSGIVP